MLRVLQQAFSEVVIKPEDWQAIDNEVNATMQKGLSQPGAAPGAQPGQGQGQPGAQPGGDLVNAAKNLPPQDKAQIEQMHKRGEPPQRILQFIQQRTGAQ
jgi:hypothetical protein